jgi:phospholipid transport system substrate-binding protein
MRRPLTDGLRTLVVAGTLLASTGSALAQNVDLGSPESAVQTLHRALVRVAADPSLESARDRYEALRATVVATHRLDYIAQLTVRRQWRDFTDEERDTFLQAFEEFSVMNYASRFSGVSDDTFRFEEVNETADGRAEVFTTIVTDADSISLDYLLDETDTGWRIINIVADGVSDLALKRAEYRRVLEEGNFGDLIAHISEQIESLQ